MERSGKATLEEVAASFAWSPVMGHNIMLDDPVLVSDSILEVVTAVREGRTRILK